MASFLQQGKKIILGVCGHLMVLIGLACAGGGLVYIVPTIFTGTWSDVLFCLGLILGGTLVGGIGWGTQGHGH